MRNRTLRVLGFNNEVRVIITDATEMIKKAQKLHGTSPLSTVALGRTLIGTSHLGLLSKEKSHKVTVSILGSEKVNNITAVSSGTGNVKGLINPVDLPNEYLNDDKFNVGKLVGKDGRMRVIKDIGMKEPYVNVVNLATGEIAEDFTYYYAISEQQPSAVSLGVLIDKDGNVKKAGGFLIQPLPSASDDTLDSLEDNIKNIGAISRLLDDNETLEDLLDKIYGTNNYKILEEIDVDYICECSEERVRNTLDILPADDIVGIIQSNEKCEVLCHFCNKKYYFSDTELQEILNKKANNC